VGRLATDQRLKVVFDWPLYYFSEADSTRAPQDAQRRWTKRDGSWRSSPDITSVHENANRAAAWRRRRVAVTRPVRIKFLRYLDFPARFETVRNRHSARTECLDLVT
jgi:hypothetical protein